MLEIDLDLVDSGDVILHRILDGENVALRMPELVQQRVKGGGLAAAGRSGREQHAAQVA